MSSPQRVVIFTQTIHDRLPIMVHIVELGTLSRQLFPDILPKEDILQIHPLALDRQDQLDNL